MKKLGILAISALLFIGVSCKKDNNSYQPDMSTNGNYSGQATSAKNPRASVLTATTTDLSGLSGAPVVNKVPMITEMSGEYVVKPIPIRNDMNNPYNDPARLTKTHLRHDMKNPFNSPR